MKPKLLRRSYLIVLRASACVDHESPPLSILLACPCPSVLSQCFWSLFETYRETDTVCDATCRYWPNEWLLVSFPGTPISFSLVQSKNRQTECWEAVYMPNMFYSNDAVQPQWSSDSVWRPTAKWVPVRSTPLPLGLQRLLWQRRFDQQPQVDLNNIYNQFYSWTQWVQSNTEWPNIDKVQVHYSWLVRAMDRA